MPAAVPAASVLFVCVHNAGRSQMAAGFLRHLAGDRVEVRSAGSLPGERVNPAAVAAMAELGIDISDQRPKVLTTEAVQASDYVITMGCGDACPIFPGKTYLDWQLEDPAGQGVDAVRPIRDEIRKLIEGLVAEIDARTNAHPLDDPVGASLRADHAYLARRCGRAATYVADVATFSAVPADADPQDWADLARLLGPGAFADMFSCAATPPADWEPVFVLEGRQMIRPGSDRPAVRPAPAGSAAAEPVGLADLADLVDLDADSVPEMLDLVTRAKPGPFRPRTREMGRYLGIRVDGRLVAMAGERLSPPGWTEISAVCTAPEARGKGHAARLVTELVARIEARGRQPFLHVAEANTGAIALYERLGFTTRTQVTFRGFRTP